MRAVLKNGDWTGVVVKMLEFSLPDETFLGLKKDSEVWSWA